MSIRDQAIASSPGQLRQEVEALLPAADELALIRASLAYRATRPFVKVVSATRRLIRRPP